MKISSVVRNFPKLYEACSQKGLEAVVLNNGGKVSIEVRTEKGKSVESVPVQKKESIDRAAKRLMVRMKKGNLL